MNRFPYLAFSVLVSFPFFTSASIGGRPTPSDIPMPRTHDIAPIPEDNWQLPPQGIPLIPQPHDWNGDALPFPERMPMPVFLPDFIPRGAMPIPAIRRGRRAPLRRQTIVPAQSSFWRRIMQPLPSIPW